jgi:hypothetical protein
MTVREFNGTSDELVTDVGAASGMVYGTVATLVKFSTVSGFRDWTMLHDSSGLYAWSPNGLTNFSTLQMDTHGAASDSGINPGTTSWKLIVVRKATGTTTPRFSVYDYSSGTWTHVSGGSSISDSSFPPGVGGQVRFTYQNTSDFFGGRIAARALWSNSLPWTADASGDAAIEASGLRYSAFKWKQNNPTLFQLFNQSDTSTPVADLSSAGTANQTSISGTTVIAGDDPPGFNFSLTSPALYEWSFDEASGDILDSSGHGRNWTPSGITTRTASGGGHTDKGLTQSGVDIALGPSLTGLQTSNRTVMAWVKQTTSVTAWLLEFYVSSIDSGAWGILFLSGQYHIQARNSSGFARASAASPTFNVWHHVAGTYDGSNVRLYIDGTLSATTALTGPLRTDATNFRVMDQSSSATVFDDARGFDIALTQAEIQSWMNTPATPASTGTKIYFQNGSQASAVYEMTAGGILVQRNSFVIK